MEIRGRNLECGFCTQRSLCIQSAALFSVFFSLSLSFSSQSLAPRLMTPSQLQIICALQDEPSSVTKSGVRVGRDISQAGVLELIQAMKKKTRRRRRRRRSIEEMKQNGKATSLSDMASCTTGYLRWRIQLYSLTAVSSFIFCFNFLSHFLRVCIYIVYVSVASVDGVKGEGLTACFLKTPLSASSPLSLRLSLVTGVISTASYHDLLSSSQRSLFISLLSCRLWILSSGFSCVGTALWMVNKHTEASVFSFWLPERIISVVVSFGE